MLITRPQPNLSSSSLIALSSSNPNPNPNPVVLATPALAPPLYLRRRIFGSPTVAGRFGRQPRPFPSRSAFVEHLEGEAETEGSLDFSGGGEAFDSAEMKRLEAPELVVKDLDELPEQWRRSKLAWLCKELPAHKSGTLVRILNAQRKWVRQDDATYLAVHCMRIRENETGFKVYKWMMQQHWYRFDFALATKLADYMGKERKFSKCREIFDDIITQGRVPCESTFHMLIVAYLSVPVEGCLEEACTIYNRMIQLGGYQPRLSLHNSLFKSIVSKPGSSAKHYLKQAEFIFHNLVTTGLAIHKEIYAGQIWLHSYQETIDKERIMALRKEMKEAGVEESKEVLVSILRACSKDGDLEEAEKTWTELLHLDGGLPSQAFVYRMEVFAKVRDPRKSLEIFREMKGHLGFANAVSYHKIVEILCRAQEVELAESLVAEFIKSGLKPVMPAYMDLMNMYFNLSFHDKVELAFTQCLEKCQPSRTVYSIYLDSLVEVGNLVKAEEIFTEMQNNTAIGISTRSCNTILRGFLSSGDETKAVKIYNMMCQKQYDVESLLIEKVESVLSLLKKGAEKPVSPKLSREQREVLVGLLLGGLKIESDEKRKNHLIHFDFSEKSGTHSLLKRHIHDLYHEWLHPSCQVNDGDDDVPYRFFSTSNPHFGFYADQFWPTERPSIPKLIHRWLSPCSLAYWYMYGGYRTPSGDILLKLKGNREGAERVLKSLKARSLNCRVKKKAWTFWIGLLGSDSMSFWKIVEPYILAELKDSLSPNGEVSENGLAFGNESLEPESESEPDERASDYSESES